MSKTFVFYKKKVDLLYMLQTNLVFYELSIVASGVLQVECIAFHKKHLPSH